MPENLLKGKKGIITGALDENSIAWHTALKAKEQGAKFVLTNAPIAMRMGAIQDLADECGTIVIPADATSVEDIEKLYDEAKEYLGGNFDFLLHSIGMSPNVRKGRSYGDLNYDWVQKSYDVSAVSFHKMLQVAEKKDILNEWASVIALSYIAAERAFPFYSDMSEAKAILESIARNYGLRYGKNKNVRVNTISQSPTKTVAGSGIGGFDDFFDFAALASPLGNASAESCAEYIVTMFSDYTRMVTMQNLYHDGGFSSMGMDPGLMEQEEDK